MRQEKQTLVRAFAAFRALAAFALISAGCAGGFENIRAVTYPPDFDYITNQEIQTTMGALASQVDALDQIMWQTGGPQPDDQARVVEILSRMRSLAAQLKPREHSSHARIDEHAPQLQLELERALLSATLEPPNYYYAGLVSGACSHCHAPRHRLTSSTDTP